MSPRPTKRKRPQPKRHEDRLRVRWFESSTVLHLGVRKPRRFYQTETLGSGVKAVLGKREIGLIHTAHQILGPAEITTLQCELVREHDYALIFRVRAGNVRKKTGHFMFLAAKSHREHAPLMVSDSQALRALRERVKTGILDEHYFATVFLPEKHHRAAGSGRKIPIACRAWPGDYRPVGIHRNGQLMLLEGDKPVTTKVESEEFMLAFNRLMLELYDPMRRNGPDLGQMHITDLGAKRARGKLLPMLMRASALRRNMAAPRYVADLLRLQFKYGEVRRLSAPEDPEAFYSVVNEVLGEELGKTATRRAVKQLRESPGKRPGAAYLESLQNLVME